MSTHQRSTRASDLLGQGERLIGNPVFEFFEIFVAEYTVVWNLKERKEHKKGNFPYPSFYGRFSRTISGANNLRRFFDSQAEVVHAPEVGAQRGKLEGTSVLDTPSLKTCSILLFVCLVLRSDNASPIDKNKNARYKVYRAFSLLKMVAPTGFEPVSPP